jgi:hypothetical protein
MEQMAQEARTRSFYQRHERALLEPGRQFLVDWRERSKRSEARISEILKKYTNQK